MRPTLPLRLLAAASLLFLLHGCATGVRSDVVTFHDRPLPMGETIRVEPKDPAKQGSLEFRRYADLIRSELRDIGYTPLPPDSSAEAELVARVDYSIQQGPAQVGRQTPSPFARYHFYYGRFYDPFYFGLFNTWDPDLFYDVYTVNSFLRRLELDIVRGDETGEHIFEGRVESVGNQSRLPEVMPYMVTAMFSNFPGESGTTKVVTIERDGLANGE